MDVHLIFLFDTLDFCFVVSRHYGVSRSAGFRRLMWNIFRLRFIHQVCLILKGAVASILRPVMYISPILRLTTTNPLRVCVVRRRIPLLRSAHWSGMCNQSGNRLVQVLRILSSSFRLPLRPVAIRWICPRPHLTRPLTGIPRTGPLITRLLFPGILLTDIPLIGILTTVCMITHHHSFALASLDVFPPRS